MKKSDMTLQRERIKRYESLIDEYELIKRKQHVQFAQVQQWAQARKICKKSFLKYYNRFTKSKKVQDLLPQKRGPKFKIKEWEEEKEKYRNAIFSILHQPPKDFGFHRTSWRMIDIICALKAKGLFISKSTLRIILKKEGLKYRKAKIALTSTDKNYRKKLSKITYILSDLKSSEKFFSIDEFGPVAIKMHGGRMLSRQDEIKIVPQFQKSKGSLILTAALELSANQIVHFYSEKKDTEEMIKLLEVLTRKYKTQDRIYLSWDTASWHASKKLYHYVNDHNKIKKLPEIQLAPLPSSSQFLNVIESVFSGLAKAIIHNSNYKSIAECKNAINEYFTDRNAYYKRNPKKAGKKIWGQEKVIQVFNESNNCKDFRFMNKF